jgi:bifunctional non-homologous end joining protein LigD
MLHQRAAVENLYLYWSFLITTPNHPLTVVYVATLPKALPRSRLSCPGKMRRLPLSLRKTNLARLLVRRPDGIFIAPFEEGEIGSELFRAACQMGLEGLVSKRRDRPYQGGRSKYWLKVKNRKHPAMGREM